MRIVLSILSLCISLQTFAATNFSPPSFGTMGFTKKVLGIYPRDQIEDTTVFPTRTIGQLQTGCTATLIGPKHILTAGHCVYDFKNQSWNNNLDYYPARNGESELPFGAITWKKVLIQKEYLENGETAHDFAVIELEESIGDKLGWSGFKVLPEAEYTNNVRITGYPGDKDIGTMWSVTCPSMVVDTGIYYECDTFGGMSGSAVYSINPDPDKMYITSIHTFGTDEINGGVILDSINFKLILSWIKDAEYSENTVINEKPAKPTRDHDRLFFKNNCHLATRLYLNYLDLDNSWKADGPWTIQPGEQIYIADTRNRIYYFAALTNRAEYVWKGDNAIKMPSGDFMLMIKGEITTDTFGDWTQILSCK